MAKIVNGMLVSKFYNSELRAGCPNLGHMLTYISLSHGVLFQEDCGMERRKTILISQQKIKSSKSLNKNVIHCILYDREMQTINVCKCSYSV